MAVDLSSLDTLAVPQTMLDSTSNLYHVFDGLWSPSTSGQKIKIRTMKSNCVNSSDDDFCFYTVDEYEQVFLEQFNWLETRIKTEIENVNSLRYGQTVTQNFYLIEMIGIGLPNKNGIYENLIRYYWTKFAQYRTVRFLISAHIVRNRLWSIYDCKRSSRTWINLDPLC